LTNRGFSAFHKAVASGDDQIIPTMTECSDAEVNCRIPFGAFRFILW
jgi:hypothetical protein